MKRFLISGLIIIAIYSFIGIFVVSENQVAVVRGPSNQDQNGILKERIATTGINYAFPFINKITYVYTNQRDSTFELQLQNQDFNEPDLKVGLLVIWRVVDPKIYLKKLNTYGFKEQLTQKIFAILNRELVTTNLGVINQSNAILSEAELFQDLGIEVIQIKINKIQILDKPLAGKYAENISVNSKESLSNNEAKGDNKENSKLAIESAYYKSLIIKGQTRLEVGKINQELLIKNPKLYEYFSKLNTYKLNAKSVKDVPPLRDLYIRSSDN